MPRSSERAPHVVAPTVVGGLSIPRSRGGPPAVLWTVKKYKTPICGLRLTKYVIIKETCMKGDNY